MSVYGGDSWAAEAKNRVQQVSDLLDESTFKEEEVKRLSNGKYACTVCSWWPVMDTLPMLSIHRGSKKHKEQAALRAQREKELAGKPHNAQKSKAVAPSTLPPSRPSASLNTHQRYAPAPIPQRAGPPLLAPNLIVSSYYSSPSRSSSAPTPVSVPFYAPYASQEQISLLRNEHQKVSQKNTEEWERYIQQCLSKGWLMDEKGVFHQDASAEFEDDDYLPPLPPSTPLPTSLLQKYGRKEERKIIDSASTVPSVASSSSFASGAISLDASSSPLPSPSSSAASVETSASLLEVPQSSMPQEFSLGKRKKTRSQVRAEKALGQRTEQEDSFLQGTQEEAADVTSDSEYIGPSLPPSSLPGAPRSMAENAYMLNISLPYKRQKRKDQ